jgi:hypothetical protein
MRAHGDFGRVAAFVLAAAAAQFAGVGTSAAQRGPAAVGTADEAHDWIRIDETHNPEGWVCFDSLHVYDHAGFRHFLIKTCATDQPATEATQIADAWVDCALDRTANVVIWISAYHDSSSARQPMRFGSGQTATPLANGICGITGVPRV